MDERRPRNGRNDGRAESGRHEARRLVDSDSAQRFRRSTADPSRRVVAHGDRQSERDVPARRDAAQRRSAHRASHVRPSAHAGGIPPRAVGGSAPLSIPIVGLAVVAVVLLVVVVFAVRGCSGGTVSDESTEQTASVEAVSASTSVSDATVDAPSSESAESGQPEQTVASHVAELIQLPDYPSGCEPTSLTIVLRAMGYDVDIADIVENYLVYDETWTDASAFLGDPYSGGGCFPPCIVAAAAGYLTDQGDSSEVVDLTGSTFDEVLQVVEEGTPVMLWTTMYEDDPAFSGQTIEGYAWYTNEHCIVVYGTDGNGVLVSDPLEGLVTRDRGRLSELFEECGSMAVAIMGQGSAGASEEGASQDSSSSAEGGESYRAGSSSTSSDA